MFMLCSLCKSSNQAEFPSELLIHFSARKHLNNPGILVFPTLSVCLDCGFLQTTVPAAELALLSADTPAPEQNRENRV
jgi:hypothetical protein